MLLHLHRTRRTLRPTAKRSTGRRTVERLRLNNRTAHLCHARVKQQLELFSFTPKDGATWRGLFWKPLWPSLNTVDVLRIRGAAKEFNDAKKHGPHADLFFCHTNMRSEAHPIRPAGDVSI